MLKTTTTTTPTITITTNTEFFYFSSHRHCCNANDKIDLTPDLQLLSSTRKTFRTNREEREKGGEGLRSKGNKSVNSHKTASQT